MKRSLSAILFTAAIISASNISAQRYTAATDDDPHSAIHLSFLPPISTNGRRAPLYTNGVSLSILSGVSKNERALSLAGLANIVNGNANGFQGAGLLNLVGGRGRGMLAAGLANVVGDYYKGGQFAGLVNVTGKLDGAQFSGLVNAAGDVEGAQFTGLVNAAGDVDGTQFAGLVNAAGEVQGMQVGGLANAAGHVDGSQFAGLVNVAGTVSGVQMAGLLNIAARSDYPIGLVNIIADGEMAVGAGYNEIGTAGINFHSGGRVLYGILGAGYNHRAPDNGAVSFTGGIGAHIDLAPKWRINAELASENIWGVRRDRYASKSGLALMPAFRFGRFEIFAGPSINHMQTSDAAMYGLFPKNPLWEKEWAPEHRSGPHLHQLFIGWQAGVQFIIKR
jgi:hypothetical protein